MGGLSCARALALFLAGAAALWGCGGDGGPSRPATRIAPAGPEPGERRAPLPDDGGTAASMRAASVLGLADALLATSVHVEREFGEYETADVGCSGLACSGPGSGAIGVGNAGPLAGAGVVERTDGIDLVFASDAHAWGGWMRHGGFGVFLERAPVAEDLGGLSEFRYGLAVGGLSVVSEGQDVAAAWRGRMVGVTETGGFAEGRLQGVAVLTWRSTGALGDDAEDGDAVGSIDAAFTDIASVSTGAVFPDVRFADVPVRLLDVTKTPVEAADGENGEPEVDVTAKMAFDAGVSGNRIRGGFFGPGRAEVGGVFEQNGILGAFGASRGSDGG